jgi:hypothetical protein
VNDELGGSVTARKSSSRRRRSTFGNIDLLPSGHYRVRLLDPRTGERCKAPFTFSSYAEADKWLARRRSEIERDVNSPELPKLPKPAQRVTFGDYVEGWLPSRLVGGRPLKTRTVTDYRYLLDNHVLPTFGTTPINAIKPADVRDWYATLCVGRPTLKARAYGLLRTVLATAVSVGVIDVNPCAIRGAGSVRRASKTKVLSASEINELRDAMPERFRALIVLASFGTMRFGELTELRRRDVDLGTGDVRVEGAVVRVAGG